jgi:hypothetical protein
MNINDLIEASKNWQPSEQDIKYFKQRMIEWELKFIEEDERKQVTQEWLNKRYTI